MLKDLTILIDDEKVDYFYETINGEVKCTVPVEKKCSTIELFYDENIFTNVSGTAFEVINVDKVRFPLDSIKDNTLTFTVEVSYKFFIKTIYKYLNKFIDKNGLLEEINFFKETKIGKQHQKSLLSIIDEIEEKSLDDLLLAETDEQERIDNLLLHNELYINLSNSMSDRDLMLLITSYISCNVVPKIDQDTFDALVKSAIDYDHALENIWRLGMNYDGHGYNFDLLDRFFVDSRDTWYLSEYISSICQVDQEKIVNLVIETKDHEFIQKLLEDNFIQSHLEEKYQQILKDTL